MKNFSKYLKGGFTLVEILVVISIVGLLFYAILASLSGSKEKADNQEVENTLSNLQLKVSQYDSVAGVTAFVQAFESYDIPKKMIDLSTKFNISTAEFEYAITKTQYALIFPLRKKDKYYCIDSNNNSKEVSGKLDTSTSINCNNILASSGGQIGGEDELPGGGGEAPAEEPTGGALFTCLYPALPDGCTYSPGPNYNSGTLCGMVISCN